MATARADSALPGPDSPGTAMTSHWTRAHLQALTEPAAAPVIGPADAPRLLAGTDLWDWWPVQDRRGAIAPIAGGMLAIFLSAPMGADPDARHGIARLRLMHRTAAGGWTDLGPLFPDGFSPGSREWSGSAVLADDGVTLAMHFTAAGRRGETATSFDQRLFVTETRLDGLRPGDWSLPRETVAADGVHYQTDMAGGGAIGTIKAFRDPAFFHDPATGRDHLLFAASLGGSAAAFNGAIGWAVANGAGWRLLPPLIAAEGLNNELERPHIVHRDGLYYLFWSTQAKVFDPAGPAGPTGLYGMVAERIGGPYRPLNGSGLVFANPAAAPHQAYSWWVTADLQVLSFADMIGLPRAPASVAEARACFGGTVAPTLHLMLAGDRAWLA